MSASLDSGASPDDLAALAARFECEWSTDLPDLWLDRSLVDELSVDYLRGVPFLPVRKDGEVLLAVADPGVVAKIPELSVLFKGDVEPLLVPEGVVRESIDRCFSRSAETDDPQEDPVLQQSQPDEDREDLLRHSAEAPVSALVSRMLLDGLKLGVSDIHMEPVGKRLQIRFRIDGVLVPRQDVPAGMEDAAISRIKIMSGLDIAERRLPQDGSAKVRVGTREVDIRVSSLPVADGERLVLRLLGRESTQFTLTELGMPDQVLGGFRRLLHSPYGVIWVTGPTGSGKTTTLYAALQEMDTIRRNVLTIEDPVEYQLPGIGQMGVRPRIGLSFAAGLRSILRQDPDVILVGETRDEETAEIVMRASMTGHLVLSTLHANDAVSASVRVCDMGVEPFLVAEATCGAMAQRLLRRLCPTCAKTDNVEDLPGPLAGSRTAGWKTGAGCEHCREGYSGRTGIFELLNVDVPVREAIRTHASVDVVRDRAAQNGFVDLWEASRRLLDAGETSLAEVRAVLGEGA
jgi:general secretion pathway protein E